MSSDRMHDDEVDVDASLVRRLLEAQFPHWARLPLEPVRSWGTDNAMFRLGHDLVLRLPRIPSAVPQVEKEQRWLPRLAPLLPLAVPEPVGCGTPADGFPWPWSVYRWLDGEEAPERTGDDRHAAHDLGGFLAALRDIDPSGGPVSGPHNGFRGASLARRDAAIRDAVALVRDLVDPAAATAAWESALTAPAWDGAPVWIHGDLIGGNVLATRGRVSAVIDFGCLGVGDPACDVMAAWTLLTAGTRDAFRAAVGVDDATWARGRGWALSWGLIALPYYRERNPVLAGRARRAVAEVLADADR
jgi:aminoglycoside phosphotransferase (APT) family kinase protein